MSDVVGQGGQGRRGQAAEGTGERVARSSTEPAVEAASGSGEAARETEPQDGRYQWIALSVTTTGALLAALQGSALLIALPDILVQLQTSFLTIMWVLLGYLLITTAL